MERVSIMNRKRRISDDILTAVISVGLHRRGDPGGDHRLRLFRGISQVNWSFLTNVRPRIQGHRGRSRETS